MMGHRPCQGWGGGRGATNPELAQEVTINTPAQLLSWPQNGAFLQGWSHYYLNRDLGVQPQAQREAELPGPNLVATKWENRLVIVWGRERAGPSWSASNCHPG
jgi:hypothetical protein